MRRRDGEPDLDRPTGRLRGGCCIRPVAGRRPRDLGDRGGGPTRATPCGPSCCSAMPRISPFSAGMNIGPEGQSVWTPTPTGVSPATTVFLAAGRARWGGE